MTRVIELVDNEEWVAITLVIVEDVDVLVVRVEEVLLVLPLSVIAVVDNVAEVLDDVVDTLGINGDLATLIADSHSNAGDQS